MEHACVSAHTRHTHRLLKIEAAECIEVLVVVSIEVVVVVALAACEVSTYCYPAVSSAGKFEYELQTAFLVAVALAG